MYFQIYLLPEKTPYLETFHLVIELIYTQYFIHINKKCASVYSRILIHTLYPSISTQYILVFSRIQPAYNNFYFA